MLQRAGLQNMVQVQPSKSPQKSSQGLLVAHVVNTAVIYLVLMAAREFEDSTSAMAFYGVYHREPLNQLIHFIGVPLILWSMLAFQAHVPLTDRFELNLPGIPRHCPTWATLLIPFYGFYYFKIDTMGALLYAPIWYVMYLTSVRWRATDRTEYRKRKVNEAVPWFGTGRVLRYAAIVHVFAWYIQIHPGHKVIEGAQPAIMQSLGGALFTAPLFAFYEGIWYLGFRKEFQQEVLALVDDYTKELCSSGASMRACEALAS